MGQSLAFCGTYTDPSRQAGFEASPDRPVMGMIGPTGSTGLYVFRHDKDSGALSPVSTMIGVVNPSFLTLDRSRRFLFAVSEVRDFEESASGAVSSFAIDADAGTLRFLNQVASGGGNPCHLSVAHGGRFLMAANHEAGSVTVFEIEEDGSLSSVVDLHVDSPADHRAAHAHFVTPDPHGGFVLSSDTGTDRVMVYLQDPGTGRLRPNDPPWSRTHPGGSPRHLAFTPSGRHLFANGESDQTLSLFRYDAVRGLLEYVRNVSTVRGGTDVRGHSTAHMLVHPNGRFVYVANRGTDTIAIFAFDEASERIALVSLESTRGKTPRFFQIDPTARWLYVCNQNSHRIERFSVDGETGRLRHQDVAAETPAPTCIQFAS